MQRVVLKGIEMVFPKVMFSSVALVVATFTLSACGQDCNAPYHEGYVFLMNKNIVLRDGESEALDYAFYPDSPYEFTFATDVETNPSISVFIYKDGRALGLSDKDFMPPKNAAKKIGRVPSGRNLYGPNSPLNLPIEVSRNDISESDMQISFEGYGSFVAPVSSEYLEVRLSLYPDIKCLGDSDDTVYLSQRVRIVLP